MVIKIKNETTAIYLGDNKNFEFNTQSSAPTQKYTLTSGTEIELDLKTSNVKNPEIGEVFKSEGIFFNFYKNNPVLLTLCVTKMIKV